MKKILFTISCLLSICIITTFSFSFLNVVYAEENDLNINSKSAILVDYNSGDILFEHNSNEKYQVASIVKLMTILLTIEAIENNTIKLTDELVASENASSMGGSQVFIDANSKYSIDKMLQSVIMASANDASVALAEHIAGSEKAFVKKMNEKAIQLGMNDTIYENSTGLPTPMQHSTAKDTATLLSYLVPNEIYHKYTTVWIDELVHPSGRKTEIVNTNKLTRYYKGCDCGKTGFTDEAGFCLASSTKRDDMRLISVIMGAKSSKDRFNQSVDLFNYGFANFINEQLIDSAKCIDEIQIKKSKQKTAKVFPEENYFVLVKKGEDSKYSTNIELNKKISAPLKIGDKVGIINVIRNGVVIKELPIIVLENIDEMSYFDAINSVIASW